MSGVDYVVLVAYLGGIFAIGMAASRKVRSSADLFAAGRQAPWWVSGLSSYMTMFSAGTFVVWGGVAYRYGMVAVVINLTYGFAAILVGFFIAGRWRSLGLTTAAEFIELRFGKVALSGYTALNLAVKMVTVGVSLYALAVMVCALMPLADGNPLQNPSTGNLSVGWAIALLGGAVVLYTVAGGLWAVLVTDVVQFLVLIIAVSLVVPLMLYRVGGISGFIAAAPENFFAPAQGEWTWWILAGWCTIQFVMIGAEWAFVQRFLCVRSPQAARQSAWLFGTLYLVSPILWMLPPMIYRTINPAANPEQAYVLACQAVLPVGAMGLVLAAMASATASLIDSQLNVFAGVLTHDFYKPYFSPRASDARLLHTGRVLTVLLGALLVAIALVAPRWGGAEALIVKVGSLCVGPLLLPTIWGLFSRTLSAGTMWITVGTSIVAGCVLYGLQTWDAHVASGGAFAVLAHWCQEYPRHADMIVGLVVPFAVLTAMEMVCRQTNRGWLRVTGRMQDEGAPAEDFAERFITQVAGWMLVGSGLLFSMLSLGAEQRAAMLAFAAALALVGIVLLWIVGRTGGPESATETEYNYDSGEHVAAQRAPMVHPKQAGINAAD